MRRAAWPPRKALPQGWVSWVDAAGTVTIRDSVNVTSITRNGTGDYTVNWAQAFGYAAGATGYAVVGNCRVLNVIGVLQFGPVDGTGGMYTNSLTRFITGTLAGAATNTDLAFVGMWGP